MVLDCKFHTLIYREQISLKKFQSALKVAAKEEWRGGVHWLLNQNAVYIYMHTWIHCKVHCVLNDDLKLGNH